MGGSSHYRSDWILRGPMDGLLRGQCSPDSRPEGASDAHILGAAHAHRDPVPGGIPLTFRTEIYQARSPRCVIDVSQR